MGRKVLVSCAPLGEHAPACWSLRKLGSACVCLQARIPMFEESHEFVYLPFRCRGVPLIFSGNTNTGARDSIPLPLWFPDPDPLLNLKQRNSFGGYHYQGPRQHSWPPQPPSPPPTFILKHQRLSCQPLTLHPGAPLKMKSFLRLEMLCCN